MAKILNNKSKRRTIRLSTDDIVNIVREYQNVTYGIKNYQQMRTALNAVELYIPEDLF